MNKPKRHPLIETVVVICEGSSEYVYLQELNRFFRANHIPLAFSGQVIGTGAYKAAVNRYRDIRRQMKNAEIVIWVDKDIYVESQKRLYENKPETIPDFLFSRMNFEDFLALHMDRKSMFRWQKVCEEHDHFSEPMCSAVYLPLFKLSCFPYYRKGKLPFKINEETLSRLFANLKRKHVRFKCDFGDFLKERLNIVLEQYP